MDPKLDVTRIDGPHSPELTVAAARLIADAVRYLNHATVKGGIEYAGDVDDVLGGLGQAAHGLQQTLSQLQGCLHADLATGRLRMDDDGRTGPTIAVEYACAELNDALAAIAAFGTYLGEARRFTARMYLAEEEESGA